MKKNLIITLLIFLLALAGLSTFSIVSANNSNSSFDRAGYVLVGDESGLKTLSFKQGTKLKTYKQGYVQFESGVLEETVNVDANSFVHYEDNSVSAFSDGTLLNFNDLSDNFINYYYIPKGMEIHSSGNGEYTPTSDDGNTVFGENIWKLTDNKYLIQSPRLSIHMQDNDDRETTDYVQVNMSEDGVVTILTKDNIWMTLSEDTYIETARGIRVYPASQLITDDTYKMSLAKITVDPDSAIVLSEGETRRQIVPEFNIETIDGDDGVAGDVGSDGEIGENGETGKNGEAGTNGENGIAGDNGTFGSTGVDGISGQNGETGTSGAAGRTGDTGSFGNSGSDGVSGLNGEAGEDGEIGGTGEAGAYGSSGNDGATGLNGAQGGNGGWGNKGADGNNAITASSINSSLPVMTFVDWQVSADGLRGAIRIEDESELLGNIKEMADNHKAKVTITDVKTGEKIPCYYIEAEVDDDTKAVTYKEKTIIESDDPDFNEIYNGADFIGFTTYNSSADETEGYHPKLKLKPDTEYNISVVAYYADVNDIQQTATIYSREFISRLFYTDSAGVILTEESVDRDELYIGVTSTASSMLKNKVVKVFLLNEHENEIIDRDIAENGYYTEDTIKHYLTYCYMTYDSAAGKIDAIVYDPTHIKVESAQTQGQGAYSITGLDFADSTQIIYFKDLTPDTKYYLRTYVSNIDDGIDSLTTQLLTCDTLKRNPVIDPTKQITAYYNRVTGGIEVYRPEISDLDNGIVKYKYSVLTYNETTRKFDIVKQTREVYPSESEPVVFYLEPQVNYVFDCTIEFNDNQKTIYFDLPDSDPIITYGSTLPKLVLNTENVTFNRFDGNITIHLDNSEDGLYVGSNDKYLRLDIYADEVYDQSITITTSNTTFKSQNNLCEAVYNFDQISNTAVISLNFTELFSNTNYYVTVSACVNINDGNGITRRGLGSVSFATRDMPVLTGYLAQASKPDGSSYDYKIALNLKVEPKTGTEDPDYTVSEMLGGEMTLGLYYGNANSKRFITSATIKGSELDGIETDGIIVSENTFNFSQIEPNTEYTVVLESATDTTAQYIKELGDTNKFEIAYPNYCTINADGILPQLPTNPMEGIEYITIHNSEAENYGLVYNKNLTNDAIIGYKLQSTYSNDGRMAKSLKYYAFEYDNFIRAVFDGVDPIRGTIAGTEEPAVKRLYEVEIVATDTTKMPSVVFAFGNDPRSGGVSPTVNDQDRAQYLKGNWIFYVGNPVLSGDELNSGMGRGFRYIFAYTLDFTKSSDIDRVFTYPYDYTSTKLGSYESFRYYGCGTVNGVTIKDEAGLQPWYVLNSGMVEAPSIKPSFNTYVYKTEITSPATDTNPTATGKVTIHYHFDDIDNLVVKNGELATKIYWKSGSATLEEQLVPQEADRIISKETGNEWYSITIPYSANMEEENGDINNIVSAYVDVTEYNAAKSNKYYELLTQKLNYDGNDINSEFLFVNTPSAWSWQNYFNRDSFKNILTYKIDNSTLGKNYFTISINLVGSVSTYDQLMKNIKARASYLKVTAQVVNRIGGNFVPDTTYEPDTYLLDIDFNDINAPTDPIEAYLTTGTLGTKYNNKFFKLDCELYYDNGLSGTVFTEEKQPFVMQTYTYDTDDQRSSYTGYYHTSTGYDHYYPIGASLYTSADLSKELRNSINYSTKYKFTFANVFSGLTNSLYVYPYDFNIKAGTSSDKNSTVANYSVIRNLSSVSLYSTGTDNISQLVNVVPTVSGFASNSTANSISVRIYTIDGFDSIDREATTNDGILYFSLYKTLASAQNLAKDANLIETIEYHVEGLPDDETTYHFTTPADDESVIKFDKDIVSGETYYIAISAKIGGKQKLLLNQTDADYAIYRKSTLTGVSIELNNVNFYNYGYFDKRLELSYYLSNFSGLKMRYDIYKDASDANSDEITYVYEGGKLVTHHSVEPVATYEKLKELDVMYEPSYYNSGNVSLILNPGEIREILKHGESYVVKMSCAELTTTSGTILGSSTHEFSLPPRGIVSAVTSLANATVNSIEYIVSISDDSHVIMGNPNYQEGKGLYTIRFTYDVFDEESGTYKEKLLKTNYDNRVYTTSGTEGTKMHFLLDNNALLDDKGNPLYAGQSINKNTKYTLHIFSVNDFDEDGYSSIISKETSETKKWDYFFDGIDKDKYCANLNNFIDTFWPPSSRPSYTEDPAYAEGIRDYYEIGNVTQRTLNDSETYYINEEGISFFRNATNKLTLRLEESFNIAENNDTQQAFSLIKYTIIGNDQTGKAVFIDGESNSSGKLFVKTDNFGFIAYEYSIPVNVSKGRYTITLQMYDDESAHADPAVTISKKFSDS